MPPPRLRRDIWSLSPHDPVVTAYADAVEAMKARAATDCTSWTYQAAIHGTTTTPSQPLWNQCQHGSWYFLPWHRMFLYYFEKIVRAHIEELHGAGDWALPYWNYGGGGNHNTLPLAFRNPTRPNGSPNPLYVALRNPGINSGAGLPPSITTDAAAMACASFTGTSEFGGGISSPAQFNAQTGQLEQTPHNVVHSQVGGLMGNVLEAALDPIFWLHHANIDRIWWEWEHHHSNPSDPSWVNESFTFFDLRCTEVSLPDKDVIDTQRQLDYTYDVSGRDLDRRWRLAVDSPRVKWPLPWPLHPEEPKLLPDRGPGPQRFLVGATEHPIQLVGEPMQVAVSIDERAAQELATGPAASDLQRRAFIDLDGIDAVRNPDVVYGVYVNTSSDSPPAELDARRAGNLSIFGIERARNPLGDEHPHGLHATLEITGVLDRMAAAGDWEDGHEVDVLFKPVTLEPPEEAAPELAEQLRATDHSDVPITIAQISIWLA